MDHETLLLLAAGAAIVAAILSFTAMMLVLRTQRLHAQGEDDGRRLLALSEQALTGQRAEANAVRMQIADVERALSVRSEQGRTEMRTLLTELSGGLMRGQADARVGMEAKLREMSEHSAARLAEIERAVHEQLHAAVERQMQGSFQRVIDQFAQVQKAMTDVQAVTAQVGDLRRVFSNVKARGGWGEMQLRTLLDDCLPGGYEVNRRIRDDSVVEFAVVMPVRGAVRPVLALDAKFPTEDYERMLVAAEQGDVEGERAARAGLGRRLRLEARKIADRYVYPPVTVEFAVMYLPTDGLYVEAARIPGLIETISREDKVLVVGPSLAPALLRTIQLGFVTLGLEQKVDQVRDLLAVTKDEMAKMDDVLERLGRKASEFGNAIDAARTRARVVQRKLRAVDAVEAAEGFWLESDDVNPAASPSAPPPPETPAG